MTTFQGLGAKFEGPDSQGFHSSVSGSALSPFVQPSGASSQTSLSLTSNSSLLPPTTHDTIKSSHHMKHLERFVEDLKLSAKRAFPNSGYSRYKEVEVLLIRWEEDELEVEWELDELHKVFRDVYGFSTEQFLIPTQNSHRKLNHKALSFVEEHEREDMLLIVYYGGHGVINKARQSTWSCKRDKTYATVEWSAIQTLFEMAKCDVLLLLDCCAGASAAPLTERPTNIKETIAACGFETWTPRPGPQSFTNTLIEVLKEWASQLPFSAAMLHSEILTRLKHAQPHRSSQGGWVESRKTPAYIVSTPDPHTASITLGRLTGEESCSSSSSQAAPGTFPGNLSEMIQGDGHVSSEDRLETLLDMDKKGERKAPHVLLTVALEEDQVLDAASCARWLKQFPLLAKYVSVEGVYRSYSTLLLLSVPVVLWDLLPDHPATQFVGYVRSRNLAPKDAVREKAVTPIPITGHSARGKTCNGDFDCTTPPKSVSGLSSIDSGYDSSGVPGPTASVGMTRATRQMTDLSGRWRNSLPSYQRLTEKRRSKSSVTELLGSSQPSPMPANAATLQRRGSGVKRPKRLIVTVGQADLNDDKLGLTCVLWYGHEVQRSQPIRRATPKPVWNEEFRFEVHNSPMFYHLRLSVWGAQMLELIGELHIDLRSLVQKGQLPELTDWQSLRCDGRTTGVIRIGLAYLDASEDEERQAEASSATAKSHQQQRQRQEREQIHDGQSRIQGLDFSVW
ncbi:Fc.00g005730.m01.CDS01 [Cosmosporella sp. VM-42]